MSAIKTAVFPVAGLGTRFLPATKANPKEMLPIVDKPLIQYAVEEAIGAGLTHMIFVTSARKRAIEDHFDSHFELEYALEKQGKSQLLSLVQNITPPSIQFTYIRQNEPLGLGHAILCAQALVGDSPFAVLLADDLIDESRQPCLSGMIEAYENQNASYVATQRIDWSQISRYGVVEPACPEALISQIVSMVEKPSREKAPSNQVAIGRYLFEPSIFEALKQVKADKRGEIQLTDGIKLMMERMPVYTWQFQGKRFDCGDKLDYFKAILKMAMRHDEIGPAASAYIKQLQTESEALNA